MLPLISLRCFLQAIEGVVLLERGKELFASRPWLAARLFVLAAPY